MARSRSRNQEVEVDDDTRVVLLDEREREVEWQGTFGEFWAENRNTLDVSRQTLVRQLERRGHIPLGGGAAPSVTLSLENPKRRRKQARTANVGSMKPNRLYVYDRASPKQFFYTTTPLEDRVGWNGIRVYASTFDRGPYKAKVFDDQFRDYRSIDAGGLDEASRRAFAEAGIDLDSKKRTQNPPNWAVIARDQKQWPVAPVRVVTGDEAMDLTRERRSDAERWMGVSAHRSEAEAKEMARLLETTEIEVARPSDGTIVFRGPLLDFSAELSQGRPVYLGFVDRGRLLGIVHQPEVTIGSRKKTFLVRRVGGATCNPRKGRPQKEAEVTELDVLAMLEAAISDEQDPTVSRSIDRESPAYPATQRLIRKKQLFVVERWPTEVEVRLTDKGAARLERESPREGNPERKVVAISKDRYRASAEERRRYGGSTVTEFYMHFADEPEGKSEVVTGYGKTPGERKTDAIRRFREKHPTGNPYKGDAFEQAKYRKDRERWEKEGRRGPPPPPPRKRHDNPQHTARLLAQGRSR